MSESPAARVPRPLRKRAEKAQQRPGPRISGLETPREYRRHVLPGSALDAEFFGRGSEHFARAMGTAGFIGYLSVFVIAWLAWNTFAPVGWQFDPRSLNYTLLTLLLSLQASYAAPLILLAQNRQADRDRVQYQEDRNLTERLVADTEYLTREIATIRIATGDLATRDFLRGEVRDLADELTALLAGEADAHAEHRVGQSAGPGGSSAHHRSSETEQNEGDRP
jgi:uncharacterized membrane protein